MAGEQKGDKKKQEADVKYALKSGLEKVKKLESYANKNKNNDAYDALTAYVQASQILYDLADATQDKKYANMADDYKTKAENLSDNAVKQLDDKGLAEKVRREIGNID